MRYNAIALCFSRAGDRGRGFAVVASEVRELSMTNDSTHQIESTIHGLTSGISKTVAKMSASLEQTEQVKHQTKDVVNAIEGIHHFRGRRDVLT